MQISIVDHAGTDIARFQESARLRVHRALDHLRHVVRSVRIRISDLNGPRGGVDRRCQVVLATLDGTELVAEARTATNLNALDRALARITRQVGESLKKRRASRHAKLEL